MSGALGAGSRDRKRLGRAALVAAAVGVGALLLGGGTVNAAFPGANGRIVFEGGGALQTITPGNAGPVTIPGTAGAGLPVWSRNGKKIAFQLGGSVWSMNADGSNQQDLAVGGAPSWAPSGSQIAFVRSGDIWLMDANGNNEHAVFTDGFNDQVPAFSPSGSKIAWVTDRSGDYQVWSMNPNGGSPDQLSTVGDVEGERPAWAPNGGRLAFGIDDGSIVDVYVVNADGNGEHRITINGSSSIFNGEAAWSPDGTRLAIRSNRTGPDEIWTITPNGGGASKITSTGGRHPDWGIFPGSESCSGAFRFGKLTRNLNRGTAKQTVILLPGRNSGRFVIRGKKIKRASRKVVNARKAKLPVRPKGAAVQQLSQTGKARVKGTVTFRAAAPCPAKSTKGLKVLLKQN